MTIAVELEFSARCDLLAKLKKQMNLVKGSGTEKNV